MFSKYEIKRGNRRLRRLARIVDNNIGNVFCTTLTLYARHTPSRWKTKMDGWNGLRKYIRGEDYSEKRVQSAMKEFALERGDAVKLFGHTGSGFVSARTILAFVKRRS